MEPIIKLNDLKKSYGDIEAVQGVTMEVYKGEMFGLVGPDGAGKTTTIRILCGLLSLDSGSVSIFDKSIKKNRKEIQNQIGYLSQKSSLYGDLTIDENIEFFADIHGVKDYEERRNKLLEFTRLTPFRKRLADNLSGGMKQKLALVCSLVHRPKILFLDEPTTGVDPVSRRDFWKILSGLLKEEITIVLTTPYLDEAERCNRVALMHEGKILSLDAPNKIKETLEKEIIEIVCTRIREAYKIIRAQTDFEVQMFGDRINLIVDSLKNDFPYLEELFKKNSIEIISWRRITPSLENIFIHLVKQND